MNHISPYGFLTAAYNQLNFSLKLRHLFQQEFHCVKAHNDRSLIIYNTPPVEHPVCLCQRKRLIIPSREAALIYHIHMCQNSQRQSALTDLDHTDIVVFSDGGLHAKRFCQPYHIPQRLFTGLAVVTDTFDLHQMLQMCADLVFLRKKIIADLLLRLVHDRFLLLWSL